MVPAWLGPLVGLVIVGGLLLHACSRRYRVDLLRPTVVVGLALIVGCLIVLVRLSGQF